jgi:hypothetical protein
MTAVAWIDVADVENVAGDTLDLHTQALWIEDVVAAANEWSYRKRRESGYHDVVASAPSDDVKLGTALYAWRLYQQRSSGAEATFDGFPEPVPFGPDLGVIRQLLGIPRGRVA